MYGLMYGIDENGNLQPYYLDELSSPQCAYLYEQLWFQAQCLNAWAWEYEFIQLGCLDSGLL
jgi:hypothetical protein